jgi:hypothetical protein
MSRDLPISERYQKLPSWLDPMVRECTDAMCAPRSVPLVFSGPTSKPLTGARARLICPDCPDGHVLKGCKLNPMTHPCALAICALCADSP